MTAFARTDRLDVHRRLSTGERVLAGQLAQNRQGVFFQYAADYLASRPSLSPFGLPFDGTLHRAPAEPHNGLFGVFADSLPDGWGTLVMDRVLRRHGVAPSQVSGMDRLAYVGDRAAGALEYAPASGYAAAGEGQVALHVLGRDALNLFEGAIDDPQSVPRSLAGAGSSGGARPKAQVWLPSNGAGKGGEKGVGEGVGSSGGLGAARARLRPCAGFTPWLVKFTSALLPLGHEESLCEAAYLALAERAGIEVPAWRLIPAPASSPAIAWLAQERFDCLGAGRYHMHSACGLLDADYRAPSLDYEDLVKAGVVLCRSPAAGQDLFARAAFNLFALNQDDHAKNWAFLQDDAGEWRPTPFYDVTFSPSPTGEHATAFLGHGAEPPLAAMQRLAGQASFASWRRAREVIERVASALADWRQVAGDLGVRKSTQALIARQLEDARQRNRHLTDGG